MKKLFLILTVLFATASSSFAWTGSQSLYAYGFQSGPYPGLTDTQAMTVNINSYCYDLEFTGSVNTDLAPSGPDTPSAGAWIYDNNTYEIFFSYSYPNVDTSKSIYYRKTSSYWASINVMIEAYLSSMAVTLRWDAI